MQYLNNPTLLSKLLAQLAVGMGTVAAPLLVMQPAMGSGFAASRTPTPLKNCLRVTIGTPAENKEFLNTLKQILRHG